MEIMVEKNLEHFFIFFYGGWRSKWAEWLNIMAITIHAKQTKTQKKNMQIPA